MMQTANVVDDITSVRYAVNSLIQGDIELLLNLLPDNVEFKVVGGGDESTVTTDYGQQAVADYFTMLGGFIAFWQVDYTAANRQVVAWGKESFTVGGTDLDGGCEFALIFELSDGMVTRLVMVEDLGSWARPAPPRTPSRLRAVERDPAHAAQDEHGHHRTHESSLRVLAKRLPLAGDDRRLTPR
jgi:hypothetical protein